MVATLFEIHLCDRRVAVETVVMQRSDAGGVPRFDVCSELDQNLTKRRQKIRRKLRMRIGGTFAEAEELNCAAQCKSVESAST